MLLGFAWLFVGYVVILCRFFVLLCLCLRACHNSWFPFVIFVLSCLFFNLALQLWLSLMGIVVCWCSVVVLFALLKCFCAHLVVSPCYYTQSSWWSCLMFYFHLSFSLLGFCLSYVSFSTIVILVMLLLLPLLSSFPSFGNISLISLCVFGLCI